MVEKIENFLDMLSNSVFLNKFKEFLIQEQMLSVELKSNKELLDFFLEKKGYNHKVELNFKSQLKFFLKFLRNNIKNREWNLQEITQLEIDSFKRFLEKYDKLAINSKILYYKSIRYLYEFYEKYSKRMKGEFIFKEFPIFERLRLDNKEIDIDNKENNKIVVFQTPIDVKLHLNGLMRLNFKIYLMERLQYESGLRFIDVARIKKKYLYLTKRYVYTKGRRGFRQYFLSKEIINDIQKYLEIDNRSENLFISNYKMQYSYAAYLKILKKLAKQLLLNENITTRSGRKTFSTIRKKYMKQPKSEVSMLMGHQVKDVTDLYINYELNDYLEMFDKYNYLKHIYLPDNIIKTFLKLNRKMDGYYKIPSFDTYEEFYEFFKKKKRN